MTAEEESIRYAPYRRSCKPSSCFILLFLLLLLLLLSSSLLLIWLCHNLFCVKFSVLLKITRKMFSAYTLYLQFLTAQMWNV